jgi:ornithine cyclodeaminase/alanine dehydrogenase
MGADAEGKQELDPAILTRADIYIDALDQAAHSGEINVPLHQGQLTPSDLAGTLGERVASGQQGRRDPSKATVFDSTGLAIQDVAVAAVIYRLAVQENVGIEVDLMGLD